MQPATLVEARFQEQTALAYEGLFTQGSSQRSKFRIPTFIVNALPANPPVPA